MSLLMDALRKAEQERKEAAKRIKESEDALRIDQGNDTSAEQQQGGDADETGPHPVFEGDDTGSHDSASGSDVLSSSLELSLAPLERSASHHRAASGEGRDREESDDQQEEDTSTDPSMKLFEDSADITGDVELDAVHGTAEAGDEDPRSSMEELEEEKPGPDLDETFHGISFEDEETPEMFEETVQGEEFDSEDFERKYEETLPGVPALQLAKDIGSDDQPTPVAAQTVFTAGNTTTGRSSGFKWLLIGSGVVVILASAVGYYYIVTPINRDLPSPLVAKGIETVATEAPPPDLRARLESEAGSGAAAAPAKPGQAAAPAAPEQAAMAGPAGGEGAAAETGPPAAAEQGGAAPAGTAPAAAEITETGQASGEQSPAAKPDTGATAAASPEATQGTIAETKPAAPEPESAPAPEAAAAGAQQGGAGDLPEAIELSPSMIRISRSRTPDARGVLLKQAYGAYTAGDYEDAAARYSEVLEQWPDNRDALLGLGAVAMKNGDKNRALEIYSHLLRIDPQDKLVRGILINLGNSTDVTGSESAIKVMLQAHPEQPFLHFALGNLYASQSHWPEAQQAFFDAYRLDSGNPDYALNLAVSLDHLGHADAALDYYKTAVQLAQGGQASFDPAALQARIDTLEAARP